MKTLKKILKWIGISILSIVVIFATIVALRQNLKFDAAYPDIHASTDSAVIAKGEYLFYGPAHCLECHNNGADYADVCNGKRVSPQGGMEFVLPIGMMRSPNISSDKETGIGNLTDAEITRLWRYGVGADGRSIFDFMPFHNTSDEDLTALLSYVRTLPPVKHSVPRFESNTMGKIVKAFLLKPVGPDRDVPKKTTAGVTVEYGEYLARSIANCRGCHTNRDLMTGAFIGPDFAGGFKMEVPGKPGHFVISRNLTPDEETGHIYNWTVEKFVERFRQGKLIPESTMPWGPFSHLSDDDLKAIYMYLKSVKPIKNNPGPVMVTEKRIYCFTAFTILLPSLMK